MFSRSRLLRVALVLGSLPVGAPLAQACGGGLVSVVTGKVGADDQRIVLSVHDGQTDVVTQIVVPATSADYGVLIPVPSMPTLDPQPVDATTLDELDYVTRPNISHAENHDWSIGCGGSAPSKGTRGVDVTQQVDIGPVTATALTADTGAAIDGWLASNGFVVPTDQRGLVDDYAGAGRFFIAIRRNDRTATGGATSIGVHFTLAGDQRALPLRFARLGAANQIAFTVFVAAPSAVGPDAPFAALTIADLDGKILAQTGYRDAVAAAVAAHQQAAFVVETVRDVSSFDDGAPLGLSLKGLFTSTQKLSRLTTVMPATALTTDVGFTEPFDRPIPKQRTVLRGGRTGTLAFASVLALLGVRQRRRSRR